MQSLLSVSAEREVFEWSVLLASGEGVGEVSVSSFCAADPWPPALLGPSECFTLPPLPESLGGLICDVPLAILAISLTQTVYVASLYAKRSKVPRSVTIEKTWGWSV